MKHTDSYDEGGCPHVNAEDFCGPCGRTHWYDVSGVYGIPPTVNQSPDSTKVIGLQIRKLLMSIRAPHHSAEAERAGRCYYETNDLRREALEYAGVCFVAPGELTPACSCYDQKSKL